MHALVSKTRWKDVHGCTCCIRPISSQYPPSFLFSLASEILIYGGWVNSKRTGGDIVQNACAVIREQGGDDVFFSKPRGAGAVVAALGTPKIAIN